MTWYGLVTAQTNRSLIVRDFGTIVAVVDIWLQHYNNVNWTSKYSLMGRFRYPWKDRTIQATYNDHSSPPNVLMGDIVKRASCRLAAPKHNKNLHEFWLYGFELRVARQLESWRDESLWCGPHRQDWRGITTLEWRAPGASRWWSRYTISAITMYTLMCPVL